MSQKSEKVIVVTGGAGFIGSALIRHLNDKGKTHIVIVDDLGTDDKWKNLVGKQFKTIVPISKCFDWLKEHEVESIIHLGACSSTVESNADFLLENNYKYTVRLAELALKNKIRFIYASSAATYGDGSVGFSDDHEKLESLIPLNMYGYSKHLFDLWAKRENVLDKMVGLKYFNVFGPNENHKGRMASMVYHVTPLAQKEGVIHLFKSSDPKTFRDGDQKRDFIYVKDAVKMTAAFLENNECGIFNIGSGVANSWNTVATSVFNGIGKAPDIQYIDMPKDLKGKYQNYTCADVTKVQKALGLLATCTPIEDSVQDYVKNHLIPGKLW